MAFTSGFMLRVFVCVVFVALVIAAHLQYDLQAKNARFRACMEIAGIKLREQSFGHGMAIYDACWAIWDTPSA